MSDESNIRWGGDTWMKVAPNHFTKVVRSPARFFPTTLDIVLQRKDEWQFFINRNYIASFNTWDEVAQTAPMLFQLHKDSL